MEGRELGFTDKFLRQGITERQVLAADKTAVLDISVGNTGIVVAAGLVDPADIRTGIGNLEIVDIGGGPVGIDHADLSKVEYVFEIAEVLIGVGAVDLD